RPNSVFYDENYNVLTYTATSSDSTIVSVRVRQSDERFNGRPSLFYAVQPGAPTGSVVTITLTADDGTGLFARDMFNIQVVNTITSVAQEYEPSVSVLPNPMADRVVITATAHTTGRLLTRILNAVGAELVRQEEPVSAGVQYRQEFDVASLPSGVYFVEVHDGSTRCVRKVVKH
ncbi:MAG: T9SS type A sorting domain-containing protein, partial [Bacteroidota bacterium]|nr:T9SS type A sorting domain-containing protein [Candidatus Kapabacteria bacterium]MDW8220683.1 T9SS type A sorting domain-containing protein [Bacteroidota bacterium]